MTGVDLHSPRRLSREQTDGSQVSMGRILQCVEPEAKSLRLGTGERHAGLSPIRYAVVSGCLRPIFFQRPCLRPSHSDADI